MEERGAGGEPRSATHSFVSKTEFHSPSLRVDIALLRYPLLSHPAHAPPRHDETFVVDGWLVVKPGPNLGSRADEAILIADWRGRNPDE